MSKAMDDPYIEIARSPSRRLNSIEIPYGDYLVQLTISDDSPSPAEEDIVILKKDGNVFENVTGKFVTMFKESERIRPTGPNLMTMMAMVFNTVNSTEE